MSDFLKRLIIACLRSHYGVVVVILLVVRSERKKESACVLSFSHVNRFPLLLTFLLGSVCFLLNVLTSRALGTVQQIVYVRGAISCAFQRCLDRVIDCVFCPYTGFASKLWTWPIHISLSYQTRTTNYQVPVALEGELDTEIKAYGERNNSFIRRTVTCRYKVMNERKERKEK